MLLSARCARAIGPFGEELCALQEGLPRKSTAKLMKVSRGGFFAAKIYTQKKWRHNQNA